MDAILRKQNVIIRHSPRSWNLRRSRKFSSLGLPLSSRSELIRHALSNVAHSANAGGCGWNGGDKRKWD